jgi:hypothetical protein
MKIQEMQGSFMAALHDALFRKNLDIWAIPSDRILAARGVPSGVELRFSGCPFEEPDHRQKNYCPDDGVDNFRADAADENKPNPRQEPAGNEGANNADHNVADEAEAVALHD